MDGKAAAQYSKLQIIIVSLKILSQHWRCIQRIQLALYTTYTTKVYVLLLWLLCCGNDMLAAVYKFDTLMP